MHHAPALCTRCLDATTAASLAPVSVPRTIFRNGVLGITHGCHYFKRGPESAMPW